MGLRRARVLTILIFICFSLVFVDAKSNPAKSFIVRVENKLKPLGMGNVEAWYGSILHSLGPSGGYVPDYDYRELLHVYKTVFNGFSARLTEEEAEELGKRPEVVGVFPDRIRQLHTTRTPQFLGLGGTPGPGTGIEEVSDGGSDVIIGVLDTGIWPEHPSFGDEGLDEVPSRWRGECDGGENFQCNKKLIGARYFLNGAAAAGGGGGASARDTEGHGTHTASTAAGSGVSPASFLGFAAGSARGVAARARIAAYKVCWEIGCADSDIVAGIDRAVEDGVDVISVSLGGGAAYPYEIDPIAISSYAAVRRGVLVSASAGNSGPGRSSVTNTAPWIFTVGASSIDRSFAADLVLEDGRVFTGSSLYNGTWPENRLVSLVSGKICVSKTLNLKPVRGSIVICEGGGSSAVAKEEAVRRLGGLGVVHANGPAQGEGLLAAQHKIPALSITASNASALANVNPIRARLSFRGTQVGTGPAPAVTHFSSRGPDRVSSYVMKPDVIAPGLNILAGWPTGLSTQNLDSGPGRGDFNIISGTSMSCPHVSGIGALLKGAHPEWTPAMIKSALMTTAYSQYKNGGPVLDDFDYKPAGPFAIGSGHVDPVRAVDPGLVYDLTENDYFEFLCASGIGEPAVRAVTQRRVVNCSGIAPEPWNLNYPAISVVLERPRQKSPASAVEVRRTVTHVGDGPATYTAAVDPPEGCEISVVPEKMVFKGKNEKLGYVVKVSGAGGKVPAEGFGKLTWSDEGKKHDVVSPIVVRWSKY